MFKNSDTHTSYDGGIQTVRPDLVKCQHLEEILSVFGKLLSANLVFGQIFHCYDWPKIEKKLLIWAH